jgi:hypothetical protein
MRKGEKKFRADFLHTRATPSCAPLRRPKKNFVGAFMTRRVFDEER